MSNEKLPDRVVFVYNAENGFFNAITSSMHRVFSPSTYECNLCFYTHDLTGMNRRWKQFLDSLGCRFAFYYRTGFRRDFPDLVLALPAVVAIHGRIPEVLVSAEEIHNSGGLDGLISLTRQRIDSCIAPGAALRHDGIVRGR